MKSRSKAPTIEKAIIREDRILSLGQLPKSQAKMRFQCILLLFYLVATVCAQKIIVETASAKDLLEIAIVTHKDIAIDSTGSEELGRLFLSLTDKIGGVRLKPVNLANNELKLMFLAKLTMMPPKKIEMHFVEIEILGEGEWPQEVEDGEALVRMILKGENVIGWLPFSELGKLSSKDRAVLKVLSVDNSRPGEKNYIFRW